MLYSNMAAILCEMNMLWEISDIKEWPQITEEDVGTLPAKDAGCEHHQKLGRNGRTGCYLLDLEPLPLAL